MDPKEGLYDVVDGDGPPALDPSPPPRAELDDLQQVIGQGSELQSWLSRCACESHGQLQQWLPYRNLLNYAENELGVVCIELSHPAEKNFFESSVPVFAIPTHKPGNYFPFNLLHDLRHYAAGDFVPYRLAETERPVPVSEDEYTAVTCLNEADATWFSDVVIPNRIGHEVIERLLGGICGARAFKAVGLEDEEQARQAMRAIEFDGIIPVDVLRHPGFQGDVRELIINRYLRFHELDRRQARIRYRTWMRQPATALAWLRFSGTSNTSDPPDPDVHLLTSMDRFLSYSEPFHPLRALVARALNFDVRVTALCMAFAREVILQDGATSLGEAEQRRLADGLAGDIDALHGRFCDLQDLKDCCRESPGSERTDAGTRILSEVRVIQREASILRDRMRRLYEDPRAPRRLQAMKDRVLPFFDPADDDLVPMLGDAGREVVSGTTMIE